MTTITPVSGTARHVVRDLVVLGAAALLTAATVTALSVVVGNWA